MQYMDNSANTKWKVLYSKVNAEKVKKEIKKEHIEKGCWL